MTKIEWVRNTDGSQGRSWNPIAGCSRTSLGCSRCYAERMAWRLVNNPATAADYEGTIAVTPTGPCWSGRINLLSHRLGQPLRRKKPTTYFVCSMADLFHPAVPADFIIQVYETMAACSQHTFIVCTKRPERIVSVLYGEEGRWYLASGDYLPNVIHLTSVENQEYADERIPALLVLQDAGIGWPVLGISAEPLLEEINIRWALPCTHCGSTGGTANDEGSAENCPVCGWGAPMDTTTAARLSWVICGCESGPGARPMDLDWARGLRDQCQAAGTPYFLKQARIDGKLVKMPELDGRQWNEMPGDEYDSTLL